MRVRTGHHVFLEAHSPLCQSGSITPRPAPNCCPYRLNQAPPVPPKQSIAQPAPEVRPTCSHSHHAHGAAPAVRSRGCASAAPQALYVLPRAALSVVLPLRSLSSVLGLRPSARTMAARQRGHATCGFCGFQAAEGLPTHDARNCDMATVECRCHLQPGDALLLGPAECDTKSCPRTDPSKKPPRCALCLQDGHEPVTIRYGAIYEKVRR